MAGFRHADKRRLLSFQKFYMVVCLVEVTTVEQLVEKLKKGKCRGENEIRAKSNFPLHLIASH